MKDLIKAIFAGIMIGIAGLVYLTVEPKWVGAIMFSVGLIVICFQQYNLFTGKIGFIKSFKEIPNFIIILLGNFLGTCLIAFTMPMNGAAAQLVQNKIDLNIILLLFKGIWCGFLMYVSIDIWRKGSPLGIMLCIPAFILAGFEHSIADMFYFMAAREFSLQTICVLAVVILGNTLGALSHKILCGNK